MKIVVTGGGGFIGANLVARLLEEESIEELRLLDDLSTGTLKEYSDERVTFCQGTLKDESYVNSVVEGADRVIHLGALPSVPRSIADPVSTIDVNIRGTLNVLEAARLHHVGHVIVASSSSVYGANPTLPKDEDLPTRPVSPYAVSKLATESLANAYMHSYDLPTIAYRFFNVFGPLQRADHAYAAVIPKFLDAIRRGVPLPIHGDGQQSRDFTSVFTVVEALTQTSLASITHRSPVNLAFGANISLLEVVEELSDIHGAELRVEFGPARVGDVPHSQASSELLKSLLPNLEPMSFREALQETYQWYMGP